MAKQKVYLDTTVPSAYYDSRTPERQDQTTRREVNLVNALKGYGQIEIIAPPEL